MASNENYKFNIESNQWQWKRVWEYHKELDNLYHRRFNFFLVAESMLIVSYATIISNLINSLLYVISTSIILLGFFFTFVWYWANVRIIGKIWFLKHNYLEKKDDIYLDYMNTKNNIRILVENDKDVYSNLHPFAPIILPTITNIFWVFLLFNLFLSQDIILILLSFVFSFTFVFLIHFIAWNHLSEHWPDSIRCFWRKILKGNRDEQTDSAIENAKVHTTCFKVDTSKKFEIMKYIKKQFCKLIEYIQ